MSEEQYKISQTAFVHRKNDLETPQNYCGQCWYIAKMTCIGVIHLCMWNLRLFLDDGGGVS